MDLFLRNADVFDGTGAPPLRRDVGIAGGRIVAVTPPGPGIDAGSVLDLDGLALAPGFVDIHTHSDVSLLHDPGGDSKALQGVTTEVVGNCGYSAFPVHPERHDDLTDHLARLGDAPTPIRWDGYDSYARAMSAAHPALNVAMLTGHSALRIAAMRNPYRPATPAEIADMARLLDEALAAGAFGLSTGLTHTPSALGDAAEIGALIEVCARHDALYATHARAVAGGELEAIDEAIDTTRRAGGRLQFSHLALNDPARWGHADRALERFDAAAAAGLDVAFDVYPYDASSSAMVQYLPEWTQAGGPAALRGHHREPAWRERALADIRTGFFGGIPWHWDRIVVTAAGHRDDLPGRSVQDIAARWDQAPEEVLLDLCAELGSAVQVVLHYRTEADMTRFLAHPLAIVGSDGNAQPLREQPDRPHPRAFGTFPRVLGRYVRDRPVLGLGEAVRKMTSAPADRLHLTGRGRVALGHAADLVVFDPATVADRATFAQPRQAPAGVLHTIVNGRFVVRDGAVTGARPGRVLRHGR
uniref:Putative D-aminoacylase n=1 Tax=Dactylosporangium aurantiacum subsp. hamdenensis TaxID=703577 RepID=E9LIR5_9ACTN|nr:putative D-aminoacylase [Dactylosporangium aurantiacum subsp. hamdenensis]